MFPQLLALCLLCSSALAGYQPDRYSYSVPVGSNTGSRFATSGMGRITGVRVWELNNNIVSGFQLRYGFAWTPMVGRNSSHRVEMSLYDGEAIAQVSGKYNPSNYIYQLIFATTRGRFLSAGQPTGHSFNHYPAHGEAELRILSGRANNVGITSLGAHWGTVDPTGYDMVSVSNSSIMALN